MANITKKGALGVTASLDRLANLFAEEYATLGIPERIASDFAHRCDLLSDAVEKRAGFDPESIGIEKKGPQEQADSDESWMKGEFTQQENRELRELQESGSLGAKANPEPSAPSAGKQAAALRRQLQAAVISGVSPRLAQALALAAKVAEEEEVEEEEEEEVEEESDGKKAGEIPEAFKENMQKMKDKAKDDDKKEDKKASHGYDLFSV